MNKALLAAILVVAVAVPAFGQGPLNPTWVRKALPTAAITVVAAACTTAGTVDAVTAAQTLDAVAITFSNESGGEIFICPGDVTCTASLGITLADGEQFTFNGSVSNLVWNCDAGSTLTLLTIIEK